MHQVQTHTNIQYKKEVPGPLQKKSSSPKTACTQDNRLQTAIQQKQVAGMNKIPAKKKTAQRAATNTGLPNQLKTGVEQLSGISMNDVQVHFNSPKPTQLQAHAYTQGTEIHLAPGQEKHLPHEAWHVVQQKQGRVKPTTQLKGKVNINDDKGLEQEADMMGAKALLQPVQKRKTGITPPVTAITVQRKSITAASVSGGRAQVIQKMDKRPSFTSASKKGAILSHNLGGQFSFTVDEEKPDLPSHNAAMPHRMSWKDIRDNTNKFHKGKEDGDDFERWTDRFVEAGNDRIANLKKEIGSIKKNIKQSEEDDKPAKAKLQKKLLLRKKQLLEHMEDSQEKFVSSRDTYMKSKDKSDKTEFLRQANSFHANVPDLGPHKGVNNPVRETGHLHVVEKKEDRGRKRRRSLSPMSRRVVDMSPERISNLAYDKEGDLITVTGETVPVSKLPSKHRKRIKSFGQKTIKSFDPEAQFGSDSPPRKKKKKSKSRSKSKNKKDK